MTLNFKTISTLILLLVSISLGQADEPPAGKPPEFWRAEAAQVGDEIVVQLEQPVYVSPRKPIYPEAMKWKQLRKASLGKTIRAFRADGEPISGKTVLESLSKPTPVVVFVRHNAADPKGDPHPYYLSTLRLDTTVLVVSADAIYDLVP